MTLKNAGLEIAANKNNGFLQTSSVRSRFPVTAGALFHWSLHLSFGDSAQQHMAVAVSASNMLSW